MEKKAFFCGDYPIRLNDAGPDGRMRLQPILDAMQDMAALHADNLEIGMKNLRELGIIWVLSRLKLQILTRPEIGDVLHLTTWPSGINRLFATRQFELRSGNTGEIVGTASSFWLTLNADTLRPASPASMLKEPLPENQDRPVYFPDLGKLPAPAVMEDPQTTRVGQFQIDYNNHMNNSYYAVQMQEWLAAKLHRMICIREFQINFNHACVFGERLTTAGTIQDNHFSVEGCNEQGQNAFQASGSFAEYPEF